MRAPVDKLALTLEAALEKYVDDLGDGAHEHYCLCHGCVFARGVRGELTAYQRTEAKLAKRRELARARRPKPAKKL